LPGSGIISTLLHNIAGVHPVRISPDHVEARETLPGQWLRIFLVIQRLTAVDLIREPGYVRTMPVGLGFSGTNSIYDC
jgi:hypothetical protein